MSLLIKNIALHFIAKLDESSEANLQFGPENIEVTEKLNSFIDVLHHLYNGKGSKAYAKFNTMPAEGEKVGFDELLSRYLDDEQSFTQFSVDAAERLKQELDKYELVEAGYLVICHYEYMGGRFMFVAIIPVTEHYSVDGELNISADKHLDTAKLQLAARIDLFDYLQNSQNKSYISFIKGRAGRKVADFFLEFLHCEEGVDAKEQSLTLVQAVEDYVATNQLNAEEKQNARKELLSYCKEQKESGQEVSIKALGDVLPSESEETDFYKFCQEQAYPLEENFPHDQAVINKVTKYSGYGNGISVSFERSHFGQDVVYNKAADTLVIHKVPPNLKAQLLALLEENNSNAD
ncbi:nucleoid-associated protein YejK [Thalassotalea sp. LPB0316]|uniref:nucleoid-associated protein YejK n=1 Tax=Thalassotalea sp. LPB0316 TaxID=2769490 RepID=UPI001867240F|nr:nucleoid-associated protein YejK [Thalassotalea sp. LPB0316]QOL24864.1 nucleoid-associated protein YejK [Thalassotalea sp. LPB0316]